MVKQLFDILTQTGVTRRTGSQTRRGGKVVLRADVDLPIQRHAAASAVLRGGPGAHLPQAVGEPGVSLGVLLRAVEPQPVGVEVRAGAHGRLGVHLGAGERQGDGVVDRKDQLLVAFAPYEIN